MTFQKRPEGSKGSCLGHELFRHRVNQVKKREGAVKGKPIAGIPYRAYTDDGKDSEWNEKPFESVMWKAVSIGLQNAMWLHSNPVISHSIITQVTNRTQNLLPLIAYINLFKNTFLISDT